ncbi:MAG TPA: diacylglycerol kinase family protein [Blastocatellia bacterium]
MKTLFIVNPKSDFGRSLKTWKKTKSDLRALGLDAAECITEVPGQATAAARQALLEGIPQIVAVGGDGTLSEVVNGYLDQDGRPVNPDARLGLLPSGTGSDFKKTLGIENLRAGLEAVARDKTRSLDVGRVTYTTGQGAKVSRFFINMVNLGLGGDVSAFVNEWRDHLPKWVGGQARFSLAALFALRRYQTTGVNITIDPQSHSARSIHAASNLIVVGNGRFAGGGMLLAPNARPDDGLFDVVITDGAGRLDVVRELPRIRRGGYIKNPKVSGVRARSVLIESERPMPLDIDGESEGFTPVGMTVLPCVIRFAV